MKGDRKKKNEREERGTKYNLSVYIWGKASFKQPLLIQSLYILVASFFVSQLSNALVASI